MTVKEICERLGLTSLAGTGGLDREVKGVYVSDLLSWVMSHAKKGDVWVTVQSHANIVAVACLIDLACIIVAEGVEVERDTLDRADQEQIPVLASGEDAYSICCRLSKLGL